MKSLFSQTRNAYYDTYIKLNYLRSRWYDPASGRFNTKDSWQGDYNRPLSLNRWMYVEGNPVNYTDHSGQAVDTQPADCLWGYIIGTDGVIICNIVTYSHHYVISTVVCPFYLFCTRTDMVDYMSRFAFPGQNWNKPVHDLQDDSVAPFGWFKNHPDIYGDGAIQVRVYNGGLTTKNITKPTHIFDEGNVTRNGSEDWNGSWRVNTDGSGQNSSAFIALVNQFAGRQIFVEVDEAMKAYILSKKVPANLRSLGDLLINFQCEIKEYQSSQ
jgi:RHS repeat-associated protein